MHRTRRAWAVAFNYEVRSGSLNLREPESCGQIRNTAFLRSAFLTENASIDRNLLRLHRRCRGFESLTAHHVFNNLRHFFEVFAGSLNLFHDSQVSNLKRRSGV